MPHILYVDDDHASRDILARLFKHHNMNIDVVETATDALQQAQSATYDLFVIDLELPDYNGWQLMEELKVNIGGSWKAAVLTSFYDSIVAQQARELGFVACFPKPANVEIVEAVQSLLN